MGKINLIPVKKSLVTAAASATFLAFSVSALATNFTIEFFSSTPRLIELSIDSVDAKTGDFTGEAVGEARGDVWEVTGTLLNGTVEMELSSVKSEKRIVASGKIDKDGMILGRAATDAGELFEWETTDALVSKS